MNVLFVFVLFFTVSEAFSRRDRQFPEYWPYIINPFDELDSSLQQFIKILMDKSPQHIEASSQNLPLTSSEERMEELIWHSPSLNSFSSNNQISHFLDKSKRNIEQLPNLLCHHQGIPKVIISQENKCHGEKCSLSEIMCNGQRYNATDYEGPLDQCSVLSLNCFVLSQATKKFEFPEGQCVLQRVLCNGTSLNPQNLTMQNISSCFVQIRCNNTFYGFEVWDYFCESTDLVCNGTRMVNYTGLRVDPEHCQIVTRPCTSVDANSSCDRAEIECDSDRWDSVCVNVIDYSSVSSTECTQTCTLQKIKCGNFTYEYSNYTGSLWQCNVAEIACSDRNITITLPEDGICRIVELECNGTLQTFFGTLPPHCSISKVICAPLPNIVNCTLYKFGCKKQNCRYIEKRFPCYDNCIQNSTYLGCECPVDYTGLVCESRRSIQCQLQLLEPLYTCPLGPQPELSLNFDPDTNDIPYDSDPQCYVFNSTDEIQLKFQLRCKFASFQYSRKDVEMSNFTYEVITDTIALSDVPQWFVVHKIFNFLMLSDTNASTLVQLTKDMFRETEPLVLTIRPKELDSEKYIVGDRIYSEFKFAQPPRGPSSNSPVLYRMFIDIADYAALHQSLLQPKGFAWTYLLLGIIIGGVAACLIGGLLWWKCHKPNQT